MNIIHNILTTLLYCSLYIKSLIIKQALKYLTFCDYYTLSYLLFITIKIEKTRFLKNIGILFQTVDKLIFYQLAYLESFI